MGGDVAEVDDSTFVYGRNNTTIGAHVNGLDGFRIDSPDEGGELLLRSCWHKNTDGIPMAILDSKLGTLRYACATGKSRRSVVKRIRNGDRDMLKWSSCCPSSINLIYAVSMTAWTRPAELVARAATSLFLLANCLCDTKSTFGESVVGDFVGATSLGGSDGCLLPRCSLGAQGPLRRHHLLPQRHDGGRHRS